jgi:hypothetical protein
MNVSTILTQIWIRILQNTVFNLFLIIFPYYLLHATIYHIVLKILYVVIQVVPALKLNFIYVYNYTSKTIFKLSEIPIINLKILTT